jgi:hypothetical protein
MMFITYYYDYDYSEGVTSFGSTPNDGARKYQYDDQILGIAGMPSGGLLRQ